MTLVKIAGQHRAKQTFLATCCRCNEQWRETVEWVDWVGKKTIFIFTCPRCGHSSRESWQVFRTRPRKRQRPSHVALLHVPPGASISTVKSLAERYDKFVVGRTQHAKENAA